MTDSEITKLLKDRSERALNEVLLKYKSYLKTIALNILQNNEDAEQTVNDTLMRLWGAEPDKIPSELGLYLARITKNLAYDRLRFEHREKRGGTGFDLILDELAECVSGNYSPEDGLALSELHADIGAFLTKQRDRPRRMFLLRYWYCFGIGEIARRVGTSENSVSATLSKTRAKLKDYLIGKGYDL